MIDGTLGDNTALFAGFSLADLFQFDVAGDLVSLILDNGSRKVSGTFRNFAFWDLGGTAYTTADLTAATTPVPLPAGLPLLLAGLGGLALLRRRRA